MFPAIIIDTETTGKDDAAQVIEMAYLCMDQRPGKLHTGTFVSLYKPDVPIQLGAMATHHILPSELENERPHTEALGDVPEAEYWIGHNVDVDWHWLGRPDVKLIDTLAMSRNLFPALDSHTQSAMIYYIGSSLGRPERARERLQSAHSAKADVENCGTVLSLIVNTCRQRGICVDTWADVYAFSEEARIPSIMPFSQKFKGLHISAVDNGFRDWYRKQDNQDKYILAAFDRYPYEG